MLTIIIILTTLILLLSILLFISIRNTIIKVEKYEDIIINQTQYLQSISDLIKDSQKHLKDLDEREVFKSDDEVGYFFNKMMEIQKELDKYMLPTNYGKKEE